MFGRRLKISILIPCHNEEKSILACLRSCINQTRAPDEIVVVNDGSTDRSGQIANVFGHGIKLVNVTSATGNKSYAQQIGLEYVTGDIFIATDGDTILDWRFIERIEKDFTDERVVAVGGYIRSLKYNWLTACRAYEYVIGQNLHKTAQDMINYVFVIPGAAGAFRREVFDQYIKFTHDTVTEDLDFTYEFHEKNLKVKFDPEAIVYTQDPINVNSYVNQMRRWYGGGWQNLAKHGRVIVRHPVRAFELSLIYLEGLVYSFLLFVLPLIDLYLFAIMIFSYFAVIVLLSFYAAIKEKRMDLVFVPLFYFVILYINAWVFLEQFLKELVLKKRSMNWFQPTRIKL